MVGGHTHLIRAGEQQFRKTIDALRKMDVAEIGVSHCTGLPAAPVLVREFGDRLFYRFFESDGKYGRAALC